MTLKETATADKENTSLKTQKWFHSRGFKLEHGAWCSPMNWHKTLLLVVTQEEAEQFVQSHPEDVLFNLYAIMLPNKTIKVRGDFPSNMATVLEIAGAYWWVYSEVHIGWRDAEDYNADKRLLVESHNTFKAAMLTEKELEAMFRKQNVFEVIGELYKMVGETFVPPEILPKK